MNDRFIKNIISMRGNEGKEWLDNLPSIINTYEKLWKLKVFAPFTLTYNYVAPAIREDGSSVVLKIGFPKDKGIRTEINAIKAFNGEGSVKIYESDPENAVMLLEKVKPGDFLKTVHNDEKRISTLANVIKKLQHVHFEPTDFNSLRDWGGSFKRLRKTYNGTTGPFPRDLFEKAEEIFNEYSQENNSTLLHGDLHEENILLSSRGWLAIDPKGIVGDPVYETAMFLHETPIGLPRGSEYKKIFLRRVAQLSEELQFDKKRVMNWAFAQSVLTILWRLEDHNELSKLGIQNAELLLEICSF